MLFGLMSPLTTNSFPAQLLNVVKFQIYEDKFSAPAENQTRYNYNTILVNTCCPDPHSSITWMGIEPASPVW